MSTITRPHRHVKPAAFGEGIFEPQVDLLELTEEERLMLYGPLESIPQDDEPGPCSTLPTIQGAGLSTAEMFRVNGSRTRARVAYAHDCPEADAIELDRVADLAGTDELRRLLKDRSAAVVAGMPEAAPAAPVHISRPLDVVMARIDPWDVEADPADWPADTDNWCWAPGPDDDQGGNDEPEPERSPVERGAHFEPSLDDRRWWCQHAPSVARPPARRKVPAPHTDRDMRRIGACG